MKNNPLMQIMNETVIRFKLLTMGLLFAVIGTIVVGILPPLDLEKIVNELVGTQMPALTLIIEYVILLAVAGLFDAAKEVMITIFGQKVTHQTRSAMSQKLSKLPASYYVENGAGAITSRVVNDVDTVETLFTSGIISMFVDVCKVISILVIIFVKSKGLGLLMIIVTPILYGFTRLIQKRMFAAQLSNRKAVAKANNHLPETIQNIRMVHTIRCENFLKNRYANYIDESYEAVEKSNFYDAIYSPIIITISSVIIAIMMICAAMGGAVTEFFGMSVGTAVAVISYVDRVFTPLESIGMEIQNIQSAIAGISRISDFLKEKEIAPANQETLQMDAPAIELEGVTFGYEQNHEILHNYTLKVMEKDEVTLTGRTGIGKSTIFKLILGLYEPWNGQVRIYGVPVTQIPQKQRSQIIGYVEQSFHEVQGNVMEQITLKNNEITKEQVKTALEIVGLLDTVENLQDGYETKFSSSLFSQGQIQLFSIARAIVQNPVILLLDEITANLDSATEKIVMDALEKASKNRTVVSISHRNYDITGEGEQNGKEQRNKNKCYAHIG